MGLCGSSELGSSHSDDDVESTIKENVVKIDSRPKINAVVVNWNMAGINENAYVYIIFAYTSIQSYHFISNIFLFLILTYKYFFFPSQIGVSTRIDQELG